ncbi:MAG: nickel pincer cofactor biosynthesis protein LarB [Planctomycetaceae bacterium]
MADKESIRRLLSEVQRGELGVDAAVSIIGQQQATTSGAETVDACVDLDRASRCGYPEVVYADGKTAESVQQIFEVQQSNGQSCLATRVSAKQAKHLVSNFPDASYNAIARTIRIDRQSEPTDAGRVVVISAGTTDRPVAEEAVETLSWMGVPVDLILDIGVAGPQRLQNRLAELQSAAAIVVVAGMEGALPSVVGGYVSCPVIGVPTSVGYGANFGGVSALLSILNSCAANVLTVNIDAGFKGGYVAGLIARKQEPATSDQSA